MKVIIKSVAIVFLLSCTNVAFGYEPGTHLKLSEQAARRSVLGDDHGVLVDLGLKSLEDVTQKLSSPQTGETIALGPNGRDLFTTPAEDTIINLIGTGAALEDEFPRSLFHFYDPVPGHFDPLDIKGVPVPYSAPNWALADSVVPVAGQSYSLKGADEKLRLEGAA